MRNGIRFGMVCAAAALVAGCHKGAPQGQVVATVNGQEVTLQELNAEVQSANLPPNADKQAAQRAMLQRLIDRKLLVGAAEDKKLDKSAEYLAAKRRADELLMVQLLARQQLTAVPVPTDSQVTQFMAEHPNAFGQREQLTLDQIRFAPPKDLKQLKALEGDHTMDAVAAHLSAMGIKFERGQAGLDTANAPSQLIKVMDAQPNEPVVIPDRGMLTVNVVVARKPVPVDPQQARAAAVAAWRQQQFQNMIDSQVKQLRSSAKIDYQPGFSPPAAPAASGAAPAPAK